MQREIKPKADRIRSVRARRSASRLWACGSLFYATEEKEYSDAFVKLWKNRESDASYSDLSWAGGYAFGLLAYLESNKGDSEIVSQLKDVAVKECKKITSIIDSTGIQCCS